MTRKSESREIGRDAQTGQFIPEDEAERESDTSIVEAQPGRDDADEEIEEEEKEDEDEEEEEEEE